MDPVLDALAELRTHAQVFDRYRAVLPDGTIKGIAMTDAANAVVRHDGRVDRSEAWLLPGGFEVLGPWTPVLEQKSAGNPAELERVAEAVHDRWVATRRAQGCTSRRSETGEELMVPYGDLSEAAKDLDRNSVRAVLEALEEVDGATTRARFAATDGEVTPAPLVHWRGTEGVWAITERH